jgi:hypothetical protein
MLDSHVDACCLAFAKVDATKASLDTLKATWKRRRGVGSNSSDVQPLLAPAHVATYLLDPLYADCKGSEPQLPRVSHEHEAMAKDLIQRVGGPVAVEQFTQLVLEGWVGPFKDAVPECVPPQASDHRKRAPVSSIRMRKGVWKRYGQDVFPELSTVALRLMSIHPTSCAAERNWSVWGRLYTSARNALGAERAKKMIAFSFNSRAQKVSMTDLFLDLALVEGEIGAEGDNDVMTIDE